MAADRAVLEFAGARPTWTPGELPSVKIDFRLLPGEFALVGARDRHQAAWLGDLCCGLVSLTEGRIQFLGRDWSKLPDYYAAALRGHIGRVFALGGWIGSLDIATNILLPQLHHSRAELEQLREEAMELAHAFGLPGLPLGHIDDVSPFDLARSAYVRAFLGNPALLVLESPAPGQFAELRTPLLSAIAAAQSRGCVIIWLSQDEQIWDDRRFPATQRFHLRRRGLWPAGRPT